MTIITTSASDAAGSFTLDGVDYPKGVYKLRSIPVEDFYNGSVRTRTFYGIEGINNDTSALVYPQEAKDFTVNGVVGIDGLAQLLASSSSGGNATTNAADLTSGVLADARVQESNVTQYKDALGITKTIEDYGAVSGGDATTNFNAIQAALNAGGKITTLGGTYNINGKLLVSTEPVDFDLNGGVITSSTNMELIDIKNSLRLYNGSVNTTFTSSSRSLLGIIQAVGTSVDDIILRDLKIDGNSTAETNAIKVDMSPNFAVLKRLVIENITTTNIGQMAIEIISHSGGQQGEISDLTIRDIFSDNTGAISQYGQVLSVSGKIKKSFIQNINGNDFKDIGIENANGEVFIIDGFKLTNPKQATDRFLASYKNDSEPNGSENVVFRNGSVSGDGIIQLNGQIKPVLVDNLTADITGRIETNNATIINSEITTSNGIQSLGGSTLTVINSQIFGSGIGRFEAINGSRLELYNTNVTQTGQNQTILMSGASTAYVEGGTYNTGYWQAGSTETFEIVGTNYINSLSNNPYRGDATYITRGVKLNGVRQDYTDNALTGVVKSSTTGEPTGSDSVLNMVSLTQAEYDAGTPLATTLYVITDA